MRTNRTLDQHGHAVAYVIAAVVVLAVGLAGWQVARHHKKAPSSNSQASTASTTPMTSADATDNASLDQDLRSIDGSLSQENTDSNAANTALNDQQSQVQVPTE